jgi:hypothetical protein
MRLLSFIVIGLSIGLLACPSSDTKTASVPPTASMTEAPANARVFFVSPANGSTVTSPVKVVFGLDGMTVKPAGVMDSGTGHHHVIVNGGAIKAGEVIPMDETHLHYGKGQLEAEIPLPPGKHTLTMQFADGGHRSYGDRMAATIEIKVTK